MAKNRARYVVDKFISIGYDRFPETLVQKLHGRETYKDQVLKEHLYGADDLIENFENEEITLTKEEEKFLQYLVDIQNKENAAYFRIVS